MIVIMLFAGCSSNPGNVNPSPTESSIASPGNNETKPVVEEKSKYYFEYKRKKYYFLKMSS